MKPADSHPSPDRALTPDVLRDPINLLGLGFGAGLSPRAPGTVGTLVGIPVALGLSFLPLGPRIAMIVLLCAMGIWVCGASARRLGVHDHPGIVLDEIVGYQVAVVIAPFSWLTLTACLILFRLIDVTKPWPISWLDRRVGGGTGIMLDDIVAGLVAGVVWLGIATWIPLIQ